MSGNQTSTTNQTQTQTANPVAQAALSPFGPIGLGVAQTAYNAAMSPQVAALNSQQQQAIQGLGGLQTNNPASPYINQANQYSQLAANPQNVVNMAQQFYNPMSQQVLNQLGNVFGQQNAQLLGNAASSGAIGGSRYGVAAGNLANQQGLAAGQTLAGLQQQALNAAQTEQGQISQQAFTQGQLGQQSLNTQIQAINAALQGGNITQQQAQALLNAAQQGAIQQTLFPQQEAAAGENIALGTTALGGTTYGTGQTTTPVNYLGQVLGGLTAGAGLISSDERVKENIEPIGKSFDKQTIYKFNYIGDPTTRIGLMAQEVQKKHPAAVKEVNGTKAVDYNKATAQSAEIGEHRLRRDAGGDVRVPETHFPQLNLNPQPSQQRSGSSGSGGGLPGIGGLSNLSSLGDGLSSLGSSAMEGIGSLGSAIGSGIGELGGAIGGALEGAGEFLPMLALLRDGGSVRQHRAIGGGTGVGPGYQGVAALGGMPNPSSTGLNYNGIQSPLAPYFAQSPQVHVPQINLPQLSLGQQGGNSAQQQQDQTAKQWSDFGSALKQNNVLGNADQALFADFGGGGADFARGGRIHRQEGGDVVQDVTAQPSISDFIDRRIARNYPIPPSLGTNSMVDPNASAQSSIASVNPVQGALPVEQTPPPALQSPAPVATPPIQQAAAPTPAQAPQPKPPQYGRNQQPKWETPEWHNWADGYGRTSIQGETGQTSAFRGLREINTHDTNGTHSYGNYGLNSGGSAQEFVRQYRLDGIGLTAQPGTPMFDWQWREAASNPVSANVLRKAEIDYYNNHYVDPTVRGMSQYLPVNIANNRAAQEYMIDKSVQQGTGTWDGNSGIGVKHIRRAQQAAEESGGDPVKFVNRMAQLDHAAVGSDFPAALHSGAYSPLGDLNRLRTRVSGALGELGEGIQALPGQIGEGIRGVFGGGQKPQSVLDRADLQPPKPGESNLDKYAAAFGIDFNKPQGLGGSLGRALGIQGGLDPQTSNRLVNMGLGMMAAGPTVGVKGFPGAAISGLTAFGKGGQYALNQEQQERAQAINLANAAMNQQLHAAQMANYQREATQPRQIGSHVIVDNYGMPHVVPVMGQPPGTKPEDQWKELPVSSQSSATQAPVDPQQILKEAKTKDIHGEDFLKTISGEDADYVRDILAGREDMPAITRQNPQARYIQQYVRQADKNYDKSWYKDHQDWMKGTGKIGNARIAADTAINHAGQLSDMVDKMPNSHLWIASKTANRIENWWRGHETDPELSAWWTNARPLADEVAAVYAAAGGGRGSALADREAALADLDPSLGRDALNANLAKYTHLIESKAKALQSDHRRSVGPWADIPEVISPENKQVVETLRSRDPRAKAQAKATQEQQAAPQQTTGQQPTAKPISVSSIEEAMKLPSGTHFITPDGREKVRP